MMYEIIAAGLLVLAVMAATVAFLYWLPKQLGYPKVGLGLSWAASGLWVMVIGASVFEDQLFTRNDAKELLAEQQILLRDDVEMVENKSGWSPGDYYHTFTLRLSPQDHLRVLAAIRGANNYHPSTPADLITTLTDRYLGPPVTQNYESGPVCVRKLFRPARQQNYAPTYRVITVRKDRNELTFEDIGE